MSQEEVVCNLYEWVFLLCPFPSYSFVLPLFFPRPFSSCRFVLSLLVFPSFLVQPCFFACFLRKQKR